MRLFRVVLLPKLLELRPADGDAEGYGKGESLLDGQASQVLPGGESAMAYQKGRQGGQDVTDDGLDHVFAFVWVGFRWKLPAHNDKAVGPIASVE